MIITLINTSDPQWNDILSRCRHDVYHTPAWAITSEISEGGSGIAAYAHHLGQELFVPMLRRELGDGRWDASSAYGYPGPICSDGASQEFLDAGFRGIIDLLQSQGCVSWFMRLHPLLNASWHIAEGLTVDHGPTVSMDLTQSPEVIWQHIRATHRRAIKKARELGMTVSVDTTHQYLDAFIDSYHSDMRRLGASSYYLFNRDYFDSLFSRLDGKAVLMISQRGDDFAGGVVYTLSPSSGIIQYHLSTTHADHRMHQPAKLIMHTAALWGKAAGYQRLHLGGGIGAAEDSLFMFKRGFNHDLHRFRSQRVIVDSHEYRQLSRLDADTKLNQDGFFPAYRKQAQSETASR
ncbi:GNAT family N-acetyltransferase [Pigmentiphaga aceris]|uniref:GNAT family N-acetyltransferase n=1 Tax=Pigmentiphaga aceris TaxID=1940612 RepID=A0A5C0AZY4_9BURK|nr:GNAT family N-acetyltransferase [Pigmentiphaga aceris]QEI07184.1 GNAT family N-acetyltransferase [Pigmentiphaga aceris]